MSRAEPADQSARRLAAYLRRSGSYHLTRRQRRHQEHVRAARERREAAKRRRR